MMLSGKTSPEKANSSVIFPQACTARAVITAGAGRIKGR